MARIRPLHDVHAVIFSNLPGQLAVADINSPDLASPSFKEDFRKSPCRGSDIKTILALRVDGENVKTLNEFVRSSADPLFFCRPDDDGAIVVDLSRRLILRKTPGKDGAGGNQLLSLAPRRSQTTTDEEKVKATAAHGEDSGGSRR
jgi:hypothetical protein